MGEYNEKESRQDADVFDPRGAIRRLRRAVFGHKWLVLATVVLTMGLVTAYLVVWPPIYTAEVLIMTEAPQDPARDGFYMGWNVFRKDDAATEANLFSTSPILTEVIDAMNLRYDDVYHPFMSHATYLWTESWLGKQYRALKESIFPPDPSPWDPTEEEIDRARTLVDFKAGVGIQQVGETNMGRLTVQGPSARVGEMANRVMDVYLRYRRDRHESEARAALEVLDRETTGALLRVEELEQEKQKFYKENGILFEFDIQKLTITNLMTLESSLEATQATMSSLEATLAELDKQLADEARTEVSSRTFEIDKPRQVLDLQLTSYRSSRVDLLNRYRPDAPEIADIESNIKSLEDRIAALEPFSAANYVEIANANYRDLRSRRLQVIASLAGTRAAEATSRSQADRMRESLKDLPVIMTGIEVLARNQHLAHEKYIKLAEKRTEAEVSMITAKNTASSMRVVERAMSPSKPSWPNSKLLLLGALATGIALGISLALLKDLYDNRVRFDDLDRGRGDSIFLGRIEVGATGSSRVEFRKNGTNGVGHRKPAAAASRSPASE